MHFLSTLSDGVFGKQSKGVDQATRVISDSFSYPSLYEEADEMLQNALLIYTVTDLRTMAKSSKTSKKLKHPERILDLPLKLETTLEMIQDNFDAIKAHLGEEDHTMALSALQSMKERKKTNGSFFTATSLLSSKTHSSAYLTHYGDELPDKELVYAIGVDPTRKRITVAFRGSVTPADFICDANIHFNVRDNPLKLGGDGDKSNDTIRVHSGFDEYLLQRNKRTGRSKFDEIREHVEKLFAQDKDRRENYRLYCTGHSLGGALATLFSFEITALRTASEGTATSSCSVIPLPVTCISVASPRVGDLSFQKSVCRLEQSGRLRHLRIAHGGDPVTMLPKSSSKKLFAMLSPISYLAFKLQDQDFAERETYRHTGIKLKLNRKSPYYELSYAGVTSAKEELEKDVTEQDGGSDKAEPQKGWQLDVPDVKYHMGVEYVHRVLQVKEDLQGMTLKGLYSSLAQVQK